MHDQPQTSDLSDDALRRRAETLRSGQLEDPGHRFRSDDAACRDGQGEEGTLDSTLTQTLETVEGLLESVQATDPAVPRQESRQANRGHVDPQTDEGRRAPSRNHQTGLPARTETQLRDRTLGSRRGSTDDQSAVGTREFYHDDEVSALSPRASLQHAQPTGLVADGPTADAQPARRQSTERRSSQEPRSTKERPSVAQVLKWGAPHFVTAHTPARIRDTLAKISLCRTAALGARKFQCEDCGELTYRYNSCSDRDCPQCQGSRRRDFNDHAAKRIIDGVVYYQVTMTLPSELSDLALYNRELFAELLPKSAWSSAKRCIESEQAYRAGAISVLHTWNQKLENHWHVHLLIPGAGPSIDGRTWKEAKPPAGHPNTDGFYFVDADRLRNKYRSGFMRRLDAARRAGRLKLAGRFADLQNDENWQRFKDKLRAVTWVAHIQSPPTTESLAHHVVNYLTRYVAGGPISDRRIIDANARHVTFMAREGKRVGGERKQVPVRLTTGEFTDRWTQHIQPSGLTKVRYFGGWACNRASAYRTECETLNPSKPTEAVDPEGSADDHLFEDHFSDIVCEHCGSDRVVLAESTGKPSWRDLLGYASESVPHWYAEAREESDKRFWDDAMGEGFNAWYLESLIESAKERDPTESPPIQVNLPGLESIGPASSYPLNSF